MKKKFKNNKGITLIALVITVIILIILAGVSISAILGNNGLATKANQAAQQYSKAAIKEKLDLITLMSTMNDGGLTESYLRTSLNNSFGNDGYTLVVDSTTGGYKVTVNEYEFTISSTGAVSDTLAGGDGAGGGEVNQIPTIASVKTAPNQPVVALSTTQTTELKDDNQKIVKVPAGFGIASDSATVVENGVVIDDTRGNQFVWIPVNNTSAYTRTSFKGELIAEPETGDYYFETLPTDEQTSIASNKGFYIGRYEAGDSTIPIASNSSLRSGGSSESNAIVVKSGYAVYNFITKSNAQDLATNMGTSLGYGATTKLCSSYAWDTAINFIQNSVSTYGSSSPQGNYYDGDAKSYTDIQGNSKTTTKYTPAEEMPTGQTTPVCNIYDMGGNVMEWTSERYSGAASSGTGTVYAVRGGMWYAVSCDSASAGSRGYYADSDKNPFLGFRVAMFL